MSVGRKTYVGLVYRAHHPKWAYDPMSGEGASRYGGRFNPIGISALYTATSLTTAWLEAQQGFAFKAQPMTMCAYEVDCTDIVDLTNDVTRSHLRISGDDLSCPWERLSADKAAVPTWELAKRLIKSGIAGALVPSFAPGVSNAEKNLVFWDWSADLPHKVSVVDMFNRLPNKT